MKSEIIEQLGQVDLLLPSLIAEGLAANDRVKLRLSILQAAAHRARDPNNARFALARECRDAGLDPVASETLVNQATLVRGDRISAPGLANLGAGIWHDMEAMLRAVKAGDGIAADAAVARLAAIRASAPFDASDDVALEQIVRLTALPDGNGSDSLHGLIMDLHKALNRLAAAHAEEVLAGAHVHALLPQDRPAVEAFMRGIDATKKLKFGHPGLETTAARANGRLSIQNDIGETDAHVIVIAVETGTITVTYTDVHLARAKFFIGLFRNFAVDWSGLERKSATGLGDDGAFYLVSGRFQFDDDARRNDFLESLGASLVFLIDWNKARKILREWVSKTDAVHVLSWAALHRVGHRAFLELGGSELVASAVHHATPTRIGFAERLDRVLGRDAAVDFLKTVMRVSAEALLQGSSVRMARDRIEAALVAHLQRVDRALLAIIIRQAGLAREIASGISRFISDRQAVALLTRRHWRNGPVASKKRPTGSRSKHAARWRDSTPTGASSVWSIKSKTPSTSLSRRRLSLRSHRPRSQPNCSSRWPISAPQRFRAPKPQQPALPPRRKSRTGTASTPKMRWRPSASSSMSNTGQMRQSGR